MKESMDESGYAAPFRSLNRYGSRVSDDVEVEELGEISRYNQIFRNKASAKRNSFDRVKYAISAHKIALGNLEEYAKIRCKDCKKSYRVSSFLDNKKHVNAVLKILNLRLITLVFIGLKLFHISRYPVIIWY